MPPPRCRKHNADKCLPVAEKLPLLAAYLSLFPTTRRPRSLRPSTTSELAVRCAGRQPCARQTSSSIRDSSGRKSLECPHRESSSPSSVRCPHLAHPAPDAGCAPDETRS